MKNNTYFSVSTSSLCFSSLYALVLCACFSVLLSSCALMSNDDELNMIKRTNVSKAVSETDGWAVYGSNKYKGQLKGNRPHGMGEYIWSDGSRYKGQFDLGLRQGTGVWTLADGMIYEGSFNNDKPHGSGIASFKDGSVYEGAFKKGFIDGEGFLKSKDGFTLAGKFTRTHDKDWKLVGTIKHNVKRSWCQGNFSFKRTTKPSSYLVSYQSLLSAQLYYAEKHKCRIAERGLVFLGDSLNYARLPVTGNQFWSSLKTKPYIKAELDDGATLSGTSSKAKLHGVFKWKSADGSEEGIQVWKDGLFFADSLKGSPNSKCQLNNHRNHTKKWLVIKGACVNGLLNDGHGIANLMNAPMPVSLLGKFVNGQLTNGQIQRVELDANSNITRLTTQADSFTLRPKGSVVPSGKTLIARGTQVIFEGNYLPGSYVGSGVCLFQGAYENCILDADGHRIDDLAQARNQARYAAQQIREKKQQQQRKVAGCNDAITYLNRSLDDLVNAYDRSDCPKEVQRSGRILQDNIDGSNFYRGGDDNLAKRARQCMANEQRQLSSDLNYISGLEKSVRNQCAGIQEGFLPQMLAYKRSIISSFNTRKNSLEARLSELASLWRQAKRQSQKADQQRREQANRDLIATIRKQGDHNAFLDSIGADRSSSGAMAQSKRIVRNHNDNVYKKQLEYQNAYLAAQQKVKRLDASRPKVKIDTSSVDSAYARARKSCERTRDTWDEANKRCTPKDRISTYTINILPSACYGDGPYCNQSKEGYAVNRDIETDTKNGHALAAPSALDGAFDALASYGIDASGSAVGQSDQLDNSGNYPNGSTGNSPAEAPKGKRALAVSWQLKSGKWKAFGPIQGSLGVVEETEAKALRSVCLNTGTLLASNGKYRIYDQGRPLNPGDMNVYSYAQNAYDLDLSQWE